MDEGKYYINLKTNNEFQINHYNNYEDCKAEENSRRVTEWLKKNNKERINIRAYDTYQEANDVLNQMVPYDNDDGICIDYELRKYLKYLMSEEDKKELNLMINEFIEQKGYKQYRSASREGLKQQVNRAIKKI